VRWSGIPNNQGVVRVLFNIYPWEVGFGIRYRRSRVNGSNDGATLEKKKFRFKLQYYSVPSVNNNGAGKK
jgi:hypothetical protein